MRKLLKYFKQRSFRVLRRKEDSGEPVRSPFDASKAPRSEPSDTVSETSTTSKFSHQSASTSYNPLADLARRVSSSESNYNESSTTAFLGLQNHLQPSWRLGTYGRAHSDVTASPYETKDRTSETFEFIVPKPVSVEESEELASTLVKWGTLEPSKSRDSDSCVEENPLVHYSTWKAGQRTPFDPPAKKKLVPFTHRSDSAIQDYCQEIGSFQLCREVLTLSQLRKYTKKTKGGTILDLRGTTIRGEGTLIISSPETTIKNGKIELSEGILIQAPGIALIDITLSSSFSHSATVSVMKRDCFINRCQITNPQGTGVQVSGTGSSVTMRQTTIFDCERNCVWIYRGGTAHICDGCIVKGSRSFHGISASDKETQVTVQDTKICANYQDGIFLTQGARALVDSCEIIGSREYHGVSIKKCGTYMTLKNCKIHHNQDSAAIVQQGAKLEVMNCSIRDTRDGFGIVAGNYGSQLEVTDTEIDGCDAGGIVIFESASGRICRTHIHDSQHGNGVVVSGIGSSTTIANSVIFCNTKNNVYIENGGKVFLDDCDIFSSVRCNGVLIREKGSSALLSKCTILKNQGCNVVADAGATCDVQDCRIGDSIVGPNLLGRGRFTSVTAVAKGSSADILKSSVVSTKGASVTLNEQKVRIRKSWSSGLKLSPILSCKVAYPRS